MRLILGTIAATLVLGCVVWAQPNTAPDWPFGGTLGDVQRRKEYDPNGDRVGVNLRVLSGTPTPGPISGRCNVICAGATPSLQVALGNNTYQQLVTTSGGGPCACAGTGLNSYAGGAGAAAAGDNSVVLGASAGGGTNDDNGVCIGESATCDSANSTLIGRGITDLSAQNTIAIGYNLVVNAIDAICIATAVCDASANTAVFGSDTSPMTEVYFGKGQFSTAPTTYRISGTKASGANVNGGTLRLQGGAGTGTGVGGDVPFYYCAAGSSGSSVNSCSTSSFYRGSDGSWHLSTGFKWVFGSSEEIEVYHDGNTSEFKIDASTQGIRLITDTTVSVSGALDVSGDISGSSSIDLSQDITGHGDLYIDNDATIGGISLDGTGKTVCIKANQTLGTCTTTVNSSGVCTCS